MVALKIASAQLFNSLGHVFAARHCLPYIADAEFLASVLRGKAMPQRWLILAILTFARASIGFQFQSVASLSPFLLEQFELSYAALGTLIGIYLLPGIAVALPGGVFGHRYGDKIIACFGLTAMTIGGLLMAQAEGTTLLTIGRVLSGTGAIFFNVLATKMVTDWFQGREVVTALGFLVTSWPLGIALALLFLPPVAAAYTWSGAMYLTAVFSGAGLLLTIFAYREAPVSSAAPTGKFEFDLSPREIGLTTLAGLVWTFYNVGFIVVMAFGPDFIVASGWSTGTANAMISTISWVVIPALPLGAWLAERIGRPYRTMIRCFLAAALAIWFVPLLSPSVPLFTLIGLLLALPAGLIMALPGKSVRPERLAIAMGIYFTCHYGGIGLLSAIAGYTRDVTGSPAAPIWFAGTMLIFATLMLVQYRILLSRPSHAASA
jgi:MFS family permease